MMWKSLLSISASLLNKIIHFFKKKNSKHVNGVNQIILNIIFVFLFLNFFVSTFWWICDLKG